MPLNYQHDQNCAEQIVVHNLLHSFVIWLIGWLIDSLHIVNVQDEHFLDWSNLG